MHKNIASKVAIVSLSPEKTDRNCKRVSLVSCIHEKFYDSKEESICLKSYNYALRFINLEEITATFDTK